MGDFLVYSAVGLGFFYLLVFASSAPKRYFLTFIALSPIINIFWYVKVFGRSVIELFSVIFPVFFVVILLRRLKLGDWRWGRLVRPYVLFMAALLLPHVILFQDFEGAAEVLFKVACGFASYHFFLNFFSYDERRTLVAYVSFAIGITLCMAVFQLVTGIGVGTSKKGYLIGLYYDPGVYTRMALLGIVIFLPQVAGGDGGRRYALKAAMLVASIVTLGYSISRNVVLSAAAVSAVYAVIVRKFWIAVVVFMVGAAVYAYSPTVQDLYSKKLRNELQYLQGAQIRVETLGSGRVGLWKRVWGEFLDAGLVEKAFGQGRGIGPHGQWPDLLRRSGVFGVVAGAAFYLRLLAFTFRRAREDASDPIAVYAFLLVLATMVLTLSDTPFYNFYYSMIIFACVGLLENKGAAGSAATAEGAS